MKVIRKEMVERERVVSMVCEICGEQSIGSEWDGEGDDRSFGVVDIECKTGVRYPDGGYGEKCEVDICPKCFKGKLVPWLESQGATVKWEDWDY